MNSKSKHIGVIMKINSCCSFDSEKTQKKDKVSTIVFSWKNHA